jgi:hypothetical protein
VPPWHVAGQLYFFFKLPCISWLWELSNFIYFLSLCIHLFTFFLYSHSKTTEAQLVSQCFMTEIKLLLHNTFSECLADNLTNSFHILMQRFVLFFHGGRPTDSQLIVSLLFPVLGVALTKWKIPSNRIHQLCGGLCHHGGGGGDPMQNKSNRIGNILR